MVEYYKKPSVKFMVNKGNYNKLMEILSFQEENIVTEDWKNIASKIKDLLLRYPIPQKDEEREIAIYPKEASELLVLLISAFGNIEVERDYTELMKRK